MADQIIIGIVVVLALGAHYWLYLWVKFRIDEGVVLAYLQGEDGAVSEPPCSTEVISLETDIKVKRVLVVCNKSNKIKMCQKAIDSWEVID